MKKVLSAILLATLVISMFGAITPAVRAGTAGTLTTSATQFWGNSLIEIKVVDPDLNLNSSAYNTMTVNYAKTGNATNALTLNESLPNSGEFIGYIRASGSTKTPANPPYGTIYNVYDITGLVAGSTFTITYSDQSPVQTTSITITYDVYEATASDITFDRSNLQYPMNGYIRINIHDLDWNFDPTTADQIKLNWSVVDPVVAVTTWINTTFTETGPNTAVFRLETSYNATANFAYTYNFSVNDGDAVKFTYLNETTPPYKYITMQEFTRTLSIPSTFTTAGDIAITVSDPNFDQKSWSKENLGTYGATSVNVTTDYGVDTENVTALLKETDVASGTFTYTLPVAIGAVTLNDGTLQLVGPPAGFDYQITVRYYANGTLKSETYTFWSTTAASITSDKTMYRATATPTLTITAPDLNGDSTNVDFATVTFPGINTFITLIQVLQNGQNVGNMSIKVNNLAAYSGGLQTLNFVESGVNTGIFSALLDLTKVLSNTNATLVNGNTVKVEYKDLINGVTSSVTFTIGVAAATVELDRTTYPVPAPAIGAITFYPTVTDSDANTNPSTIQNTGTKFWWTVYASNGTMVASGNPTLTETGPNTGIFDNAGIGINYGPVAATETAMTNGWIKLFYLDPSTGENVTATAMLRATDASLSVSTTSVQAGDTIVVTVTDPDSNRDSGLKQTISVLFDYYNLANVEQTGLRLALKETGANTGVFTGNLTIGQPFAANTTIQPHPGSTIEFTYEDWLPSTVTSALPNFPTTATEYTRTVGVKSFTGTVTLDKTEYGLGAKMLITVWDPDLNTDTTAKEVYGPAAQQIIIRIQGLADQFWTITEENVSSPYFYNDTGTVYQFAVNPDLIGKTFVVYYKDTADASGNTVYASASGTIMSWDAVVSFDKEYYSVGDVAKITVNNPDNNTDPTLIENIQVTVTSDHDPVGQAITLTETDVNTGIFEGNVQVSSSIATGKVYAAVGDTLTATFTDKLPADYATTGKSKDFTGTAIVGVPVARPVPASAQAFVDPNTGATVTSGTVGIAVGLQATIENVDAVNKTFTAIFQVKDSAGVVIFISWVSGTLTPGLALTQAVSWTPTVAGDYTVEVLVVKTLAEPTPYSDKLSATLTVA